MTTKGFCGGKISVYAGEYSFGQRKPEVVINWSAIGSVSIQRAQEFADAMTEAITYAKAEEERLGIR